MATQQELDATYMGVALLHAKLSKATRKKVGACIVTKSGVILSGYNGMSPGGDNILEIEDPDGKLTTKEGVIHAEENCILKAAKEGVSLIGSTLYVSMICCFSCSERIISVGISTVVYGEDYRCNKGITNLINRGMNIRKWVDKD
jgi:dCMP deaminase